jgi:hypothetical protein
MSDQETTHERETRFKQFLIFVLLTGAGMLAGFDLAEQTRTVFADHIDRIAEVERFVRHLWFYTPIGTAVGVAAGFVFGYALRRATWGELSILIGLDAVVLGLGMLGRACLWLVFVGTPACVFGIIRE